MSMFITDALAATDVTQVAQSSGSFSLIMLVAIFVLFYFMLIRPQNKKAKAHRELINNLKKGDEIITVGGILGKVVNIDDQYIKLSLAEGVEIIIQRHAVNTVLPKGTLKSL